MKTWTRLLIAACLVLAVVLVLVVLSNIAYRAENHQLKAMAQAYVLRDDQVQGRYLAAVDQIGLLEVQNEKARAKIQELQQKIILLAEATVVSPEVVYVDIPGVQVEGSEPPPEFAGAWEAETDVWAARFRFPPPTFDVTVKSFEAELEIAVTDEGVIFVSSLDPRLTITDVQGIQNLPRLPSWGIEASASYPGWEVEFTVGRRVWGSLWGLAGIRTDFSEVIAGVAGLRFEW